ncbi:MAG: phosphomannomutase [Gammaproteobacteria bacterium]|nr:phosphomannomutase [Gammaproteobacteria bacterium]
MTEQLTCFKAYDVRGRVPEQLNADVAYRIGRAFAAQFSPKRVVVGFDIRLTSQELCAALSRGLTEGGADVTNIGQCGTEEIYFATSHLACDGGIMVTASHNPADYNGMKFVGAGSLPISGDTGLFEIKRRAEQSDFGVASACGSIDFADVRAAYINKLLNFVEVSALRPLKIVCNAGNGGAGATLDLLAPLLPFEFVRVHHEADGTFPNGVPNPMLEENRAPTTEAIIEHGADLGIAWDGDFDRCFFFDESGRFIDGYYLVGLLAQTFCEREPGARIVHDPRLLWNTQEVVAAAGGSAVQSKTGHAFMKEAMRAEEAVYGGEMSAHHYFRDFYYSDSGMIPWLLVTALIAASGKSLSQLVDECMTAFPASGEINRTIDDPQALLATVRAKYAPTALAIDETDGLSLSFSAWRFNLRLSNTEPVVRLNVESRNDEALMREKTEELLQMMA